MPGGVKLYTEDKNRIAQIIQSREEVFIVSVKGRISEEWYNKFLEFPPIFRNLMVGKQKKLTQLQSTMGQFMTFNNYHLWYLIDYCHFVVEDAEECVTFYYNKERIFTEFVTNFMNMRIKAMQDGKSGMEKFCKMIMNSAYGKDLLNSELFSKILFKNKEKTLIDQCLPTFKAARQIIPDFYVIERDSYYYSINTAVQEGFFTLDNAKVILLSFYYSFIATCLDHNRFHLVEGDTDSLYFAISGDPNAGVEQQFTHIIIDKELYDKLYYEWFPNPALGKEDEKNVAHLSMKFVIKKLKIIFIFYYYRLNFLIN
jgi:hypothetical protein